MNINEMNVIIEEIKNCPKKSRDCKRTNDSIPLFMEPRETQKIMLITRDPSNIANENKTLLGYENTFFRNHILSIFYEDYDFKKAKNNIKYFDEFQKKFEELVYWTHYSKCFPGVKNGSHKKSNGVCSKKYLDREIKAVSPKYIIAVSVETVKFLGGKSLLESIHNNGNNIYTSNDLKAPFISLVHPSNANNKAKNNPKYQYDKTIKLIREIVKKYSNNLSENYD